MPVYVMDLPQMKRAKDVQAWAEEITALKDKVEEFTGNKVTAEKLGESIRLINDKEERWKGCITAGRVRYFQSAVQMPW